MHSTLGSGFPEIIYQKALALEMKSKGLTYKKEQEIPVYYNDIIIGKRRVDFLVEEKVLVELKAVSELDDRHYNQILNYLTAYQLEIGLRINFGGKSLKFKRFIKNLPENFC